MEPKITPEEVCRLLEKLEVEAPYDLEMHLLNHQTALDLVFKFCHLVNCKNSRCIYSHEDWTKEFRLLEEELVTQRYINVKFTE